MPKMKRLAVLFAMLLLILNLASCGNNATKEYEPKIDLNDNTTVSLPSNTNASETVQEQKEDAGPAPIDKPVYEEPNIENAETVELIYFPIALDDTGIKLPSIDLSPFGVTNKADQDDILNSMSYRANYILYGIGLLSGWFDPNEYLVAVSEANIIECIETPIEYSGYNGGDTLITETYRDTRLEIGYELTSIESDTSDWSLNISLTLYDKENPYLLDSWYEISTSVSTIYDIGGKYSTGLCPFEIDVESEIFGSDFYDASLEGWFSDIYSNYEDDIDNQDSMTSTTSALSDSALEYEALPKLHQIASDIKYEYRNNGYKLCTASPYASLSVINRTNDMVLVQGKINIWLDGGGDPDGYLTVTLIMNPYSGDVIDWYFK